MEKEHARKRALVTPYFRGKGLEAWQGVIMRNAVAILGDATADAAAHLASRFEPGQTVDIVEEFCNYLPVYVITEMLGLPQADYPRFKGWYTAHTNFVGAFGSDPEIDRIGRAATAELWDYLTPIIAERRANPASDLISTLVTAEVDGEMFDDIEVKKTHITQLLNAGSETTGKALASMIALVLEKRELFEEIREDRSKVTAAISETLRYIPPSQMNSRQVTEDIELHGQHIPSGGSLVVLMIGSANRDESRFEHPDVFDPQRSDLDHEKVFNNTGGEHFCIRRRAALLPRRDARPQRDRCRDEPVDGPVPEYACRRRVHADLDGSEGALSAAAPVDAVAQMVDATTSGSTRITSSVSDSARPSMSAVRGIQPYRTQRPYRPYSYAP